MIRLSHILFVGAALALSGCAVIDRVSARTTPERPADAVGAAAQDSDVMSAGGVDYVVEYRANGLWRDASGTAGPEVGAPQITVARADGTMLVADDILAARGVAKAYCAENPQFRRDTIYGDGVVIEDGKVIFSEICD
ncbi:hypothetical protein GQE99_13280 [Maritimibacter sp. DP07]|uniref:Lipoprotein n=1 Tax=Maritimibacter harenae TaxID=2606218 RepID=A0A845M673_9RHOB|nr:hypothetical protein [Maritimibacter harenae]MZR13988.1 hypothetical protein [Maritimibacter harenae]